MGENSTIEWTDHTFNPWRGCAKVSPGCANCYAETMSLRNLPGSAKWGPNGTRIVNSEKKWAEVLKWNARAEKTGVREKVFCASLADVFENFPNVMRGANGGVLHHGKPWYVETPYVEKPDLIIGKSRVTMSDVRRRLFELIDNTPHLDWQLVTKRPENIRRFWVGTDGGHYGTHGGACSLCDRRGCQVCRDVLHRKNVWLLTSVENQEQADIRIPELLRCRDLSPVLGLSCEPLLGPVSVRGWLPKTSLNESRLDWVIAGGESGPGARPMHPDWARGLRDQCTAAGVPFFFKQWGDWIPYEHESPPMMFSQNGDVVDGHSIPDVTTCVGEVQTGGWMLTVECDLVRRAGKKLAGRLLDGREWNEMPTVG